MQVDSVVVGLPDLDDRACHGHAARVEKSAAEFHDVTRRRTTRPLHDHQVAVPIGRLGDGIVRAFRLRRREVGDFGVRCRGQRGLIACRVGGSLAGSEVYQQHDQRGRHQAAGAPSLHHCALLVLVPRRGRTAAGWR